MLIMRTVFIWVLKSINWFEDQCGISSHYMLAFHILLRMIFKEITMGKNLIYHFCLNTGCVHGNGVCMSMYGDWMLIQVIVWTLMFSRNKLTSGQWNICKQWWSQQWLSPKCVHIMYVSGVCCRRLFNLIFDMVLF